MSHVYTYEALVVAIQSVTPNVGPTAGGTPLQILGRGFRPTATSGLPTVTLDGAPVTVSDATDAQITVTGTPAHAAGYVDVTVTAGAVSATLAQGFLYRDAAAPPQDLSFRQPSGTASTIARTANAPATISQALGQPFSLTFSTPHEPQGLTGISWSCLGQLLFDGLITKTTGRSDGRAKDAVWDVACLNNAFLLQKRFPVGSWTTVAADQVLTSLMGQYGTGFLTAIEPNLPTITVSFDGSTDLWSAIIQICNLAGAHAFVASVTLHVFTLDSHFDPPGSVTDDNPDLCWPEQGQAVTYELDYSQLANSVTVKGAGGISALVEDNASIGQFGRLPFPLNDNQLSTQDECIRRGQQFLKQHAQPVPTAKYSTRDLKTMAGKTVLIAVSIPHIAAQFVISNVTIDQLENMASGGRPRFSVTAVPAWAPAEIRSDPTARVLQAAVDLADNAKKQPKLDGDVTSAPGGRTTIPPGSIAATQLAGCIDSTKMTDTGVDPGSYGMPPPSSADERTHVGSLGHIVGFTVDSAGRITAAYEDPVAVIKADGSQVWTADQAVGGHKLTGAADPTAAQDVATKAYVDAHAGGGGGTAGAILANGTVPFAADESMGSHKLTNVTDPTNPQDAATKAYVDAHGAGAVAASFNETPGGAINGANTAFTTANPYPAGTLRVFLNGLRLVPADFTETGASTFSLTTAPIAGDLLRVDYGGTGGGGTGGGSSGPAAATEVTRGTNQVFTSGTAAAVSFDTVAYDTSGMWSASAPTRLTATAAGRYYVHGELTLGPGLAGVVHVRIVKNGTTTIHAQSAVGGEVAAGGTERHTVDGVANLAVGDYLEIVTQLDLLTGTTFAATAALAEAVIQAQVGPQGPVGPVGPPPLGGGASSYASGAQTIPNVTETAITLNTNSFDQGGYWNAGTPTRLTVPAGQAGVYAIDAQTKWNLGAGSGAFYSRLYKNGTTLLAEAFETTTVPDPALQVGALAQLAAGDYIELRIYQSTGGAQATVGGPGKVYLSLAVTGGGSSGSGGGGGPVTGHLAITAPTTITSPVNLSTLGTVDWFTPVNSATPLHLQATPHKKMFGYGFLEHWWVYGPSGFTSFTGTTINSINTTAADDATNNALAAYNQFALIYNSGAGVVGYGWAIRVRARQGSRTLKLGIRLWSGTVTITAHLSDGSAPDVSTGFTIAAGAGDEKEVAITYNAAVDNEILTVQCLLTTNSGSNPHVGLIYGYIF